MKNEIAVSSFFSIQILFDLFWFTLNNHIEFVPICKYNVSIWICFFFLSTSFISLIHSAFMIVVYAKLYRNFDFLFVREHDQTGPIGTKKKYDIQFFVAVALIQSRWIMGFLFCLLFLRQWNNVVRSGSYAEIRQEKYESICKHTAAINWRMRQSPNFYVTD